MMSDMWQLEDFCSGISYKSAFIVPVIQLLLEMKDFKRFLVASTIHGLPNIAYNRKFGRVFWIFIVFVGFILAAKLIQKAFTNWSKRPVSTTIETLPIHKLTLPTVTVCPPKNSFLNLNYDIAQAETRSLDENLRKHLLESLTQIIQETFFEDLLKTLDMVKEEKRYYNWYHGYTRILFPYYRNTKDVKNRFEYRIFTNRDYHFCITFDLEEESYICYAFWVPYEVYIKDFSKFHHLTPVLSSWWFSIHLLELKIQMSRIPPCHTSKVVSWHVDCWYELHLWWSLSKIWLKVSKTVKNWQYCRKHQFSPVFETLSQILLR